MTSMQRIRNILGGIVIIGVSILLFKWPDRGLSVIGGITGVTLMAVGIRNLWFYFTMARHMVDGRNSLYTGIILFDLGIFAYSISFSRIYVIIYLLGIHAFYGVVDILLSLDARKIESPSWRLKFLTGLGNLAIAVAAVVCGFFIGNEKAVVDIYAAGLMYTGLLRIINALRRTAVVYIQ